MSSSTRHSMESRPHNIQRLHDIASHHAGAGPGAIALIEGHRRLSYAALAENAATIAAAMAASGTGHGERVAYLGRNSICLVTILFASSEAGAIFTPLNWRLAEPELAFILADSGARMLFVDREHAVIGARLLRESSTLGAVICVDGPAADCQDLESWKKSGKNSATPGGPDDIAVLLYTSGTTGQPKGVMLRHRNFFIPLAAWRGRDWTDWAEDDIALAVMPLFHIGGLGWLLMSLKAGVPIVIAGAFDAAMVLGLIARERITRMFLVPSAINMLLRQLAETPQRVDSLRLVLYGASPMPLDLLREGLAQLKCQFVQLYGMTETFGAVVALESSEHSAAGSTIMRSAGRALPGVELAILDLDGEAISTGDVGQVAIRSASNMAGYWNRLDATARALDSEGWLRTGDAGYLDSDGYLYIHDRMNDMIISGGENIYPAEVENAIFGHPNVAEVAVVGVPDARLGDAVMAFIVPNGDDIPTREDIVAWTRTRIASFKAPRQIRIVASLPRNGAGKVLRRVLRASAAAPGD